MSQDESEEMRKESKYRGSYELRMNELDTNQTIGDNLRPQGSGSTSIRPMRGTDPFLAEMLVLKGVGVGDVNTSLGFELVELVRGVWVTTDE
jgi:hypothetical protein